MRPAVGLFLLVLLPDPHQANAQSAHETIEKVRVCSLKGEVERHQCLEKVFRDTPRPPSAAPADVPSESRAADTRASDTRASDNWIVSETTSPVDYSPVVVAAASSGTGLRLSIECRAGRTDLAIRAAALTQGADDYSASYSANGGAPVPVPVVAASPGPGLVVKADVVRLLAMLPDQGDVIFRVAGSQATTLEGRFALPALKSVLERLVIPCRWVSPASRRSP
jgi:hypothetical protein